MKNKLLHWSATLTVATVLSVGIGYLFAWSGPTDTPPNANVPAPINVGSIDQTKTGDVCTSKGGSSECLSTKTFEIKLFCGIQNNDPDMVPSCPAGWNSAGVIDHEGSHKCWNGSSWVTQSNDDGRLCYR